MKLYQSVRGDQPVREFVEALDDQTKGKFLRLYDLLRDYGPRLTFPHAKRITKDISELRIRGKTEVRIFYARYHGMYILLHAFKKKTQKTPSKELHIAQLRLTDI
ncbi:hypothetical protein A3A63_01670 [Candidatus Gottesmanbacteria bacterium RIFCSPLOWO2_01_FULL_46_9]|uniref:Addiction module toxin RelE n=1 Tax=Candidatus Gottesmanbacteria bacterium RIFCSPLOWO2_01_FULL_46_9 TaxID=1798394 RepID=A0A1F6B4R8_9BACT|nr:MAG: hypothetical protein A3A63_01670 [Candidatus Gottesmanbacteria bacterium RIFCSPLOWO2_01_FULL_46_9]